MGIFIYHRNEPRGRAYSLVISTGDWEKDFDFVKDVGRKTLEAITIIVNQHKELSWSTKKTNNC